MAAIGGSIESISIRNRLFPVASDADATRKLGGFENEVQSNGNGTARIIKTRIPWSLAGIKLEIDDIRGDQEFLQEVSDGTTFVPIAITFVSGLTYQASGIVIGELPASSQSATADLSFSGPGEMSQQ